MNQVRLSSALTRNVIRPAARLSRPVVLRTAVRHAGLGTLAANNTWGVMFKQTADHGPEILVLFMYFCLTSV